MMAPNPTVRSAHGRDVGSVTFLGGGFIGCWTGEKTVVSFLFHEWNREKGAESWEDGCCPTGRRRERKKKKNWRQ